MKRRIVISALVVLLVLVVSAATLITIFIPSGEEKQIVKKPFYFGVTYGGNATFTGGNATAEAKLLIDRVKNYTNLFILQSGTVQLDPNETKEICDYAVNSGLNVILFLSTYDDQTIMSMQQSIIDSAKVRWENHFLGAYYDDEPGGKMLDANIVKLIGNSTGEIISRTLPIIDGLPSSLTVTKSDGTRIDYEHTLFLGNLSSVTITYPNRTSIFWTHGSLIQSNGTVADWQNDMILVSVSNGTNRVNYPNGTIVGTNYAYYPNGTVTKSYSAYSGNNGSSSQSQTKVMIVDRSDAPQVEAYEQVIASLPFRTYDDTAARFADSCQSVTGWLRNQQVKLFTSDYGMYWFDYLGGYGTVLAELGWNHTTAQDIALVRGAANMQNKNWGVIITWKYTQLPYLGSGDEIYSQMRMAYEAGAEYVAIFNYPTIAGNPYGVLQEEHFQALERFWKEVVQNPEVANGGVKAEAALVLPRNYGWGMRNPNDTIWGMWPADNKSQQVWTLLQNKLAAYGSRLDIVYDDPAYPVSGKYPQIYYWNQTG